MIDDTAIKLRYSALDPVLDERGRRRFAAAEALAAGRGGVVAVSRITGIARSTIGRGLAELRGEAEPEAVPGRVRRKRAGRPALVDADPTLIVVSLSGDTPAFAELSERARAAGVRCETVALVPRPASASALALNLAGLNERLIVMNRGTFDDALAGAIASLRRIPVLVTEPDAEKSAAPPSGHAKTAPIL